MDINLIENDEFAKLIIGTQTGILIDRNSILMPNNTSPFINIIKRSLSLENVKIDLGKYKKIKNNDPILTQDCSICLSKYEEGKYKRELKCGHVFHKKCVDKWFKNSNNCPICRRYIY